MMNDMFDYSVRMPTPLQGLLVFILYKGHCPFAYAFTLSGHHIITIQEDQS